MSENENETVLQLIPSGVGVFDLSGNQVEMIYVNDGYYQMIGAKRGDRVQYTGTDATRPIFGEDLPGLFKEAQASIQEKRMFQYRFRILDGEQRYRWIAIRANHFRRADGKERFYAGYYDVDEMVCMQERMQEKMQDAEKRFHNEKLRMRSMQSGILAASCFNVTKDYAIDLNNNEVLRYDGLQMQDDIRGTELYQEALATDPGVAVQNPQTLRVLLLAAKQIPNQEQRREFIRLCDHIGMMKLYEKGEREKIIEYRRWTGKGLIWVATRVVLLTDPQTDDILAFYYTSDINDRVIYRKTTEKILKQTYESVTYYDMQSGKLYMQSEETLENAKFSPAEYADAVQKALKLYVSEEEQEIVEKAFELPNILEHLEKEDLYTIYYTGRDRDENLPGKPLKRVKCDFFYLDESRDIIIIAQTNATEIFEQEREIREKMAMAMHALEIANQAKSEFVSRISHDIRTPISIISSITDFALADLHEEDKLIDDLQKIKSADAFLLSLINDVLDISKIDSGKIELNPEPYPYEEHSMNIRNMLETMCAEKGIHCVIERRRKTGVIVADKIRLNQITLNLISNAVKFTPKGGTVTYISDSEDLPDNKIRWGFEIKDTGIGMSEEFQKKMFDSFSQEYDNPNRPKGMTGTGLGLAIVKKIIDLMGGTLEVKSELGKGTTIRGNIIFPDALRDPAYQQKEKSAKQKPIQKKKLQGKILLAEDNPINTEIALRILSSFGLTVDCVDNGEKAVEKFKESSENEYLAILMDIQMPVMGGYEATQKIRALGRTDSNKIQIIAMTADAFADAMIRGKEAGMSQYLVKPLDTEKLRKVLEDCI